jgi:hypothetical protein
LSEIQFDAPINENYYEFIEIVNLSETDSVDLTGWKISDGKDHDDIIQTAGGIKIAPLQYAVILDPGYFDNEAIYDEIIPGDALLLTIDGSTFGSGGLSNSTAEKVSLIKASMDTVSSYLYTLDNAEGFSDEKFIIDGPDTEDNWKNSTIYLGTPGAANSVRPIDFDIGVSLTHSPELPEMNTPVTLLCTVRNYGVRSATGIELIFYHDVNSNGTPEESERTSTPVSYSDEISPGDSVRLQSDWIPPGSGFHTILCRSEMSMDENLANDLAETVIAVAYEPLDLVINEIMYSPFSSQAEWFELYNPRDEEIDLNGWTFSDSRTGNRITIADSSIKVLPDSYIVLAEDQTIFDIFSAIPSTTLIFQGRFPALNDSDDSVVLYDLSGKIIDQVDYQTSWGKESGVSLERVSPAGESSSPDNWGLNQTPSGGTPGEKNSTSPLDVDLSLSEKDIQFAPPYALIEDTLVTITAAVRNIGLTTVSQFNVYFYHDANRDSVARPDERLGTVVVENVSLQPGDSLLAQYMWNDYEPGVNLIIVEIDIPSDDNDDNNLAFKKFSASFPEYCVVINEIMYNPLGDDPEWIEIHNRTNAPVDLLNWKVSNSQTDEKVILNSNNLVLQPNDYFVIAADTLSTQLFSDLPSTVLYTKKFPSLKNNGDDIYLYDMNDKFIDMVPYRSFWGGGDGISLERINPDVTSIDNANWNSCVRFEGGTPGTENSIFIEKLPATGSISVSPDPFSPDADGFDDVAIIDYQLPDRTSTVNLKIYDMRGRLVRFLLNNRDSGATGTAIWDGTDEDGNLCRIGIYIIYLEALNAERGNIVSLKKTVVLAARL